MSFDLEFHPLALAEWRKLDGTVASQFKKKLAQRLVEPRVPSAAVSGAPDLYKIKLRTVGFRLVYKVQNQRLTVLVLSVGKRERNLAYEAALHRLTSPQ